MLLISCLVISLSILLDRAHGQALTTRSVIIMIGRNNVFVILTARERIAEKNNTNSSTKNAKTTIILAS